MVNLSSINGRRLCHQYPELEQMLSRGGGGHHDFGVAGIRIETIFVEMRDGVRLATDLYLPPTLPAAVIAMRTPYGRAADKAVGALMAFARRGYVVVAQDCRGTGDSEPETWDYYVYEEEDGLDLVQWISQQDWCNGFIGACGSSYVGQTQWPMAKHPAMSAIVPHVSGLGFALNTARLHMFLNAYKRSVGKGSGKLKDVSPYEIERSIEPLTMSTGFVHGPLDPPLPENLLLRHPHLRLMSLTQAKRWLWELYCSLPCRARSAFLKEALNIAEISITDIESLPDIFGHSVSHDSLTLPSSNPAELCRAIKTPVLMITSWYDWGLHDSLSTWRSIRQSGEATVGTRSRLIVTPHSHNSLGYREGIDRCPELQVMPGLAHHWGIVLHWFDKLRTERVADWPTVIYYLMGANEWRVADDWPVPNATSMPIYLEASGRLSSESPNAWSDPDVFTYDPCNPTPTVGGSILSYLYPAGSVDVSVLQNRSDMLIYTTEPLVNDIDVVGPLRFILYASTSSVDTDFVIRLSDVFPNGRALHIQNGILRARHRQPEPKLLEPGEIVRLEIDMWATANRFKCGHRLRVDISSSDFPRFDRNANTMGDKPIPARQLIYHDPEHPSHLLISILRS